MATPPLILVLWVMMVANDVGQWWWPIGIKYPIKRFSLLGKIMKKRTLFFNTLH
jgi:hypothetical protein